MNHDRLYYKRPMAGLIAATLAAAPNVPLPPLSLVAAGGAAFVAAHLSGCAGGSSINVASDITAFENNVIAAVEAGCQVEPVLADIALLVPVYGTNVAAAANAICAAVKNIPPAQSAKFNMSVDSVTGRAVRLGLPPVVVHGVTIHFQ